MLATHGPIIDPQHSVAFLLSNAFLYVRTLPAQNHLPILALNFTGAYASPCGL